MAKQDKSVNNFPNLRFPGFEDEWEVKKLGDICKMQAGKFVTASEISASPNVALFPCYGGNGLRGYTRSFNYDGRYSLIGRQGALCGNVTFTDGKFHATEHAVVVTPTGEIETEWMFSLLKFLNLNQYATGMAQPGLSVQNLGKVEVIVPKSTEQKKISSLLSLIDERIIKSMKIIEVLKTLKVQTRKKLIVKIIKEDYEPLLVKEILNYEQPTKYIVLNTDYSDDKGLTPVLTANKSFILGYTDENFGIYEKGNCIILDDFTMDLKYVNFPFKVKSSAIKILKAKEGINLKFVFEYFSFANFSSNEHKRHYISEIEKMSIVLPKIEIQNKIARFLTALDEKINLEIDLLTQYELQKRYLLSNLFV